MEKVSQFRCPGRFLLWTFAFEKKLWNREWSTLIPPLQQCEQSFPPSSIKEGTARQNTEEEKMKPFHFAFSPPSPPCLLAFCPKFQSHSLSKFQSHSLSSSPRRIFYEELQKRKGEENSVFFFSSLWYCCTFFAPPPPLFFSRESRNRRRRRRRLSLLLHARCRWRRREEDAKRNEQKGRTASRKAFVSGKRASAGLGRRPTATCPRCARTQDERQISDQRRSPPHRLIRTRRRRRRRRRRSRKLFSLSSKILPLSRPVRPKAKAAKRSWQRARIKRGS